MLEFRFASVNDGNYGIPAHGKTAECDVNRRVRGNTIAERIDPAAMITLLLAVVAFVVASLSGLVIFTAITARRVEKALPPRGQFLEVLGARIHYLDKGVDRRS